ncbi:MULTISPECIES: toprim domain-containing protein [Alistipes]|uniref:Mobilization protein n=1 Tax=Alistipes shahii TaxID=328814 RepID=A0A5B3GFY9_9BACT|nr:toprim domain-containing protein [Alistipes shahii]KAA2372112.1 mobilization protein [Alistipes shahii]
MKTIQAIKCLSIRAYLAGRGLRPTKDNPRYGLYLSPLRKEHTPSFKVDYAQNLWYDFGLGAGGSIIDLVMRLERCDFAQALRLLGNGERTPMAVPVPSSDLPTDPALRLLSDIPLRHPALVGYLSSRGIDPIIASACCREVHYAVGGRNYFAVGFRNDAGGWELRSERFKGSVSPKHITTIDNRSDTVVAFEGFMDFLSFLSMKPDEWPHINIAVLNSVVNLPKAIPFLSRHATIYAFFDNDNAGRKTTADLKRLCPNSTVIDRSHLYREHKDLNEFWQTKQHRQQSRLPIVPKRKRGMKM